MFSRIDNKAITNIFQVGVVDFEDGIGELTIFHIYLFIQFEDTFLKFESIDQYSKLSISLVDDIKFDFSFEIEDEMTPVKSSILEIIMEDVMADNRLASIDIYGGKYYNDSLICDALSFHLSCGQELFFDPTYFFGIKTGDARLRQIWLNNYPNTSGEVIEKMSVVFQK